MHIHMNGEGHYSDHTQAYRRAETKGKESNVHHLITAVPRGLDRAAAPSLGGNQEGGSRQTRAPDPIVGEGPCPAPDPPPSSSVMVD